MNLIYKSPLFWLNIEHISWVWVLFVNNRDLGCGDGYAKAINQIFVLKFVKLTRFSCHNQNPSKSKTPNSPMSMVHSTIFYGKMLFNSLKTYYEIFVKKFGFIVPIVLPLNMYNVYHYYRLFEKVLVKCLLLSLPSS